MHRYADRVSVLRCAHRALSMVGLMLIALGTGGIKPCVAAFGGDQFEDHQVRCRPSTHRSIHLIGYLKTHALYDPRTMSHFVNYRYTCL